MIMTEKGDTINLAKNVQKTDTKRYIQFLSFN